VGEAGPSSLRCRICVLSYSVDACGLHERHRGREEHEYHECGMTARLPRCASAKEQQRMRGREGLLVASVAMGIALLLLIAVFTTSSSDPHATTHHMVDSDDPPVVSLSNNQQYMRKMEIGATTTATSEAAGSERVRAVTALLRSILFFGDSLTSGAYYAFGGGRLVFTMRDWSVVVAQALNEKVSKLMKDEGDAPTAAHHIKVTHRGYPGKDSKALAKKLRGLLRQANPNEYRGNGTYASIGNEPPPTFSLVVILSGTNDIVGLRNSLPDAVEQVRGMMLDVSNINCGVASGRLYGNNGGGSHHPSMRCGSAALLTPPMNFSAPLEWYADPLPRAFCAGKPPHVHMMLHQRQLDFNKRMLTSLPASCAMFDWTGPEGIAAAEAAGVPATMHGYGGRDEVRSFWSDCLHPNGAGYDRFGRMVAEWLWDVATHNRSVC
jgi:hypothetical protein